MLREELEGRGLRRQWSCGRAVRRRWSVDDVSDAVAHVRADADEDASRGALFQPGYFYNNIRSFRFSIYSRPGADRFLIRSAGHVLL